MDITKSVFRKLGKANIPPSILPAVFSGKIKLVRFYFNHKLIEEKQTNEPTITFNSVDSCLQLLTQCHETINKQDASSFVLHLFLMSYLIFFFLIVPVIRIVILKVVNCLILYIKKKNKLPRKN
jgi:hypothetical protein